MRKSDSKISDYLIGKQVGSGSSGSVFLAIHKLLNIQVAIKIIDLYVVKDRESYLKKAQEEFDFVSSVHNQHVIKYFDIFTDDSETNDVLYIVMEYVPNGSLRELMEMGAPLKESLIFHYFLQICSAIDYLHNTLNIVHRDLKAENLLLSASNDVKIIDFGLSRSFSSNDLMTTRCGSPCYSSPEIIVGQAYSEKTDIWSLGIVLYYMATGSLPFIDSNIQKLFYKIVNENVTFPADLKIDNKLKDLICRMLEKNPDRRPSVHEILNHPWLTKNYTFSPSLSLPTLNQLSTHENYLSKYNIPSNLSQHQYEVMKKIASWHAHNCNSLYHRAHSINHNKEYSHCHFYQNTKLSLKSSKTVGHSLVWKKPSF